MQILPRGLLYSSKDGSWAWPYRGICLHRRLPFVHLDSLHTSSDVSNTSPLYIVTDSVSSVLRDDRCLFDMKCSCTEPS